MKERAVLVVFGSFLPQIYLICAPLFSSYPRIPYILASFSPHVSALILHSANAFDPLNLQKKTGSSEAGYFRR